MVHSLHGRYAKKKIRKTFFPISARRFKSTFREETILQLILLCGAGAEVTGSISERVDIFKNFNSERW